ncbi:MAG: UDP-N-acetylmuramoyl-L-alanyl-D-glutamate--2,6-diaminopimelate ligase [Thermodesulfobacteriota bacterium]
MKLSELTGGLDCRVIDSEEVDIMNICYDSREVTKDGGVIFAAIKGASVDGFDFIEDAVRRGASSVLTAVEAKGTNVPQVVVSDVRAALAVISERLLGEPASKLEMIGITGTNGKTTCAYLVEAVLKEAGFSTGVIGTVNYRYAGKVLNAHHTTPEAPEISKLLKEMVDAGSTHCVMEVSSHALAQKRADGCRFKVTVFTNLTHEHLDYHHTMEDYFSAKSRLFTELTASPGGTGVIDIDDEWGRRLSAVALEQLSISLLGGADIFPIEKTLTADGIEAAIQTPVGEVLIRSTLTGEYNLKNIMAAVGVGVALDIDADTIARGISGLKRIPGRLESIESAEELGFKAYVDYAHTADALERVLSTLGGLTEGRLITVFGCGGDRDREKRPAMGEAAARLSSVTIITSDNPRSEDPLKIIAGIESGLSGVKKIEPTEEATEGSYMVIAERREAIEMAVTIAGSGDTIVVAGKGHEDYQIVGSERLDFDDRVELTRAMRERMGGSTVH